MGRNLAYSNVQYISDREALTRGVSAQSSRRTLRSADRARQPECDRPWRWARAQSHQEYSIDKYILSRAKSLHPRKKMAKKSKDREPGIKKISIPTGYRRGKAPEYSAQPKGGGKRKRNKAICYENEIKKPFKASLTTTVLKTLEALAVEYKISRSEVIERTFRGILNPVNTDCASEFEEQIGLSLDWEAFTKIVSIAASINLKPSDFLAQLMIDKTCYEMVLNLARRLKIN